MSLRVLTWNLLHGRAVPSAGHALLDEFAQALADWPWDVALLQEVPPWWPVLLGRRLSADARTVLTSRNSLLPVRRAIAVRWPDLIKSNGGGANAMLVRGQRIEEHRTLRLRTWPERRWLQGARLSSGAWVGNLHATVRDSEGAVAEAHRAARALTGWAGPGTAVVLGGDFNVRSLSLSSEGFTLAGGHDVDLVFARGLEATAPAEVLERGRLSDHAPVAVTLDAVSTQGSAPAQAS
ncbi:MAG: endonuclease/exonuclease/phosphatase family protein [Solirubrobacteraceae bacterium]